MSENGQIPSLLQTLTEKLVKNWLNSIKHWIKKMWRPCIKESAEWTCPLQQCEGDFVRPMKSSSTFIICQNKADAKIILKRLVALSHCIVIYCWDVPLLCLWGDYIRLCPFTVPLVTQRIKRKLIEKHFAVGSFLYSLLTPFTKQKCSSLHFREISCF